MPRESRTTPAMTSGTSAVEDIIIKLDLRPKPAKKAVAKKTAKKAVAKKTAAKKTAKKAVSASTRAARTQVFKARRARPTIDLLDLPGAGVGTHMMQTAHLYEQVLSRALRDDEATAALTVPRLQVMQVIGAHDGICGAEVSRATGVRPQTLTYLLNQLMKQHWIADDNRHGRAQDWVLTAAGRDMLQKGMAVQAVVEASLASAYSHDGLEASTLVKLLTVGRDHLAAAKAVKS